MCQACSSAAKGFGEGSSTSTGRELQTSLDQGTSPDWTAGERARAETSANGMHLQGVQALSQHFYARSKTAGSEG